MYNFVKKIRNFCREVKNSLIFFACDLRKYLTNIFSRRVIQWNYRFFRMRSLAQSAAQ